MNHDMPDESRPAQLTLDREALRVARLLYEDRGRIADTIHDGLVQYMVGAKMWTESLEEEQLSEDGKQAWRTILDALSDGVTTARQLIADLRGPTVTQNGLPARLTDMGWASSETSILLTVETPSLENTSTDPVNEDLCCLLAGLVDDLVTGLRSAGHQVAGVSLREQGTELVLEIEATASFELPRDCPAALIWQALGGAWNLDRSTLHARLPLG